MEVEHPNDSAHASTENDWQNHNTDAPEHNAVCGSLLLHAIPPQISWHAVPGDGDCAWHACCHHHNATFAASQHLTTVSYKSHVMQCLHARVPQLAQLWGIDATEAHEILQHHTPRGVWMDARLLLAIAYFSDVAMAVWDEPAGTLRLLQTGRTFTPDRPVWPLRFTPGHYSPGQILNRDDFLALLVSVELKPWSLKTCSIYPGGMFSGDFESGDIYPGGMLSGDLASDCGWSAWHAQLVDEYPCAANVGQALHEHSQVDSRVRPTKRVRFNTVLESSYSLEQHAGDVSSDDSECSASCDCEVPPPTNTVSEDSTARSHDATLLHTDSQGSRSSESTQSILSSSVRATQEHDCAFGLCVWHKCACS
eukprot:6492639-Amphidinium_carterae.2